jgi:hypothetical protein
MNKNTRKSSKNPINYHAKLPLKSTEKIPETRTKAWSTPGS